MPNRQLYLIAVSLFDFGTKQPSADRKRLDRRNPSDSDRNSPKNWGRRVSLTGRLQCFIRHLGNG